MVIRKFQEGDLERLVDITIEAFRGVAIAENLDKKFGVVAGIPWYIKKGDDVRKEAKTFSNGIFVAEIQGEVVGYVTTTVDEQYKTGRIMNLAVDSSHRSKGLGKALINHALDFFRQEGMVIARIETLEQNPVGRSLYPKIGFEEIAHQIHYALKL